MPSTRAFDSTRPLGACMVTLLLVMSWATSGHSEETSVVNDMTVTDKKASAIEEEILGPLRIWHVVFIVVFILLIILVVVCCCLDIRVPRSRQEIIHNYKKRLMNEKYLRALERKPDELIQQHRDIEAENNKRLETISQLVAPKTLPKPTSAVARLKNAVEMSTFRDGRAWRKTTDNEDTGTRRGNPFKPGIGKALPVNPKDILALVAQQKKRNAQ